MVQASHCLFIKQSKVSKQKTFFSRKPIAFRLTGRVKWFHVRKGYGFIHSDDLNSDVFIHYSAIIKNNPRKFMKSVAKGEVVHFDVVMGSKSLPEAANVTGPNNKPVRGSRYATNRRQNYSKSFKLQQRPQQNSHGHNFSNKLINQQQRNRRKNVFRGCCNSEPSSQLATKDLGSFDQSFSYHKSRDSQSVSSESGYESEQNMILQNKLSQGNMLCPRDANFTNIDTYNLKEREVPISYAEASSSDEF